MDLLDKYFTTMVFRVCDEREDMKKKCFKCTRRIKILIKREEKKPTLNTKGKFWSCKGQLTKKKKKKITRDSQK